MLQILDFTNLVKPLRRRIVLIGGFGIFTALALALLAGCATIPGKTAREQEETIDHLVARTLADIEKQFPSAKKDLATCAGYVVMSNRITKIPLLGAGSGYGVGIDKESGEKTYLKMSRFDIGMGWGARGLRPVLIFTDRSKYKEFVNGDFDAVLGAEASAKVGDKGAAGGAGKAAGDTDVISYVITDAGVSATFSFGVIRVKPIRLKD